MGKLNTISKYAKLYFSMLAPRKRKQMAFGAWFGNKYDDNSRYLFEYVTKNRKDITAVWITDNEKVYNDLKAKKLPVMMADTKESRQYIMSSKYVVISTDVSDIGKDNSLFIGNAVIINLWHGIPIKKIMYDNEFEGHSAEFNWRQKIYYYPMRKKYLLSTGKTMAKIYEGAFRMDASHIVQMGQPRNDYFFEEHTNPIRERYKGKKILLYMPTHRNEGKTKIDATKIFDLDMLNELCLELNSVFVIKKHFYHKDETSDYSGYEAVCDITSEAVGAQELLDCADVLITDYSSCYIDYLLLDRPIVFYNYDMDTYQLGDRQLYFPYGDVTPGDKCKTYLEIEKCLKSLLQGNDEYVNDRERVRNIFYNKDNQNVVSEKMLDFFLNKVK